MLLRAEEEPKAEQHRAFAESLPGSRSRGAAGAAVQPDGKGEVRGGVGRVARRGAAASGLAEFEGFTAGRRRDQEAVAAALSLEWSNGQTEGQINRLKTSKRQMYGRANFDLLRARVLHRAQA